MAITDALQNKFKKQFAESLQEALNPLSEDNYFLFFGKATSWSDENVPPAVIDSVSEHFSASRNGLFATRIDARNSMLVIPRVDWTPSTVYDEYDDSVDLHDISSRKNYYVLVDGDKVYKCISNGGGIRSTDKPELETTPIFTTSEGYQWKFLYKLTENQKDFLTKEYLPVVIANKSGDEVEQKQYDVQLNAVDGGLYRIEIDSSGDAYPNAVFSQFIPSKSTKAGDTTVTVSDSILSSVAGAYVGYMFYVSAGKGSEVGQLRRITKYTRADDNNMVITLETPLDYALVGTDTEGANSSFKILPEIRIHGDGTDASAVVNVDANKKASQIQILNVGKNYTKAYATFPTGNGGTSPTARVHIAPKGGHGSNVIDEFDASRIMIRLLNENVENQPEIINVNDYRQYGIIKNPVLNDNSLRIAGSEYDRKTSLEITRPFGVSLSDYFEVSSPTSTFKVGEFIYGHESKSVGEISSWTMNSDRSSGTLVLNNQSKNFVLPSQDNQLIRINFGSSGASGDYSPFEKVTQYQKSGLTAEGVVQGWNSTDKELVVRLTATGESGALSFVTESPEYAIVGSSSNAYHYDYASLTEAGGELIGTFGTTTGTFKKLQDNTKIARITQTTNTFIDSSAIPVYKMTTSMVVQGSSFTSGTFTLDEGITQENNRLFTTANVASWTASSGTTGTLVLTNVLGNFTAGSTIEKETGDGPTVTSITNPDIVTGSGEVLYIQNIRPIQRQQKQREEFRISIGF